MAKVLTLLVAASLAFVVVAGRRGKKKSKNTVKNFCGKTAQRAVATTRKRAKTVVYEDLEDFVTAFATPYDGNETLRLSTPQFSNDQVVLDRSYGVVVVWLHSGTGITGEIPSRP